MFLAECDSACNVRHIDANHRFALFRSSASQTVDVNLHYFLMTPVSDNIAIIIEMRNPARHGSTDAGDKTCDGTGLVPEWGSYVPVERRCLVTVRQEYQASFIFGLARSVDSRIEALGDFAAGRPGHTPVDLFQHVRQRTIVLTDLNGRKHYERAMRRENAESGFRTTGKAPERSLDRGFREFESRRCGSIQFHIGNIHALRYIHYEQISVGVLRYAERRISGRDTEKNKSQDEPRPYCVAREFHGNGSRDWIVVSARGLRSGLTSSIASTGSVSGARLSASSRLYFASQ